MAIRKHNPCVKAWQNGYKVGLAEKSYTKPRYTGEYGKLMAKAHEDGYAFAPKVLAYERSLRERGVAK